MSRLRYGRQGLAVVLAVSLALALIAPGDAHAQADFRRGDANADGVVDLADAAFILAYKYRGGAAPDCLDAADANDDTEIGMSDGLRLFFALFEVGAGTLGPPGTMTPGPSPDEFMLPCTSYEPTPPPALGEHALGFECPSSVPPGFPVDVYLTLTTSGLPEDNGPEGWSIGVGADGARIAAITVDGIDVTTTSEPRFSLAGAGLELSSTTSHSEDSLREGAYSAVLLPGLTATAPVRLAPNGTQRMARVTLMPEPEDIGGPPVQVTLRYENGWLAGQDQPYRNNVVVVNGTSQAPTLGSCTFLLDPTEGFPDCNLNRIPDEDDIASGTSADCNRNGVPDECDLALGVAADCNGNGVLDSCDIADGTSADCNGNGVPDECDLDLWVGVDCNANGMPDSCDLEAGTSLDADRNGRPDECDRGPAVFRLAFGGPEEVVVPPEETTATFTVPVLLTTANKPDSTGVAGWQLSLTVEGGRIDWVGGLEVSESLDHDGDPATPPIVKVIEPITYTYEGIHQESGREAMYVVGGVDGELRPWGTQAIARVTVTAPVPSEVTLRFEEGVYIPLGPSLSPKNALMFHASDSIPVEGEDFTVSVHAENAPGLIRGDCNADAEVDISDAVETLGGLFLGEGTFGCEDACDSNDDDTIDISDAVATLGVLFLGQGSIPPPGTEACGVDPTEDPLGCDVFDPCPQ